MTLEPESELPGLTPEDLNLVDRIAALTVEIHRAEFLRFLLAKRLSKNRDDSQLIYLIDEMSVLNAADSPPRLIEVAVLGAARGAVGEWEEVPKCGSKLVGTATIGSYVNGLADAG